MVFCENLRNLSVLNTTGKRHSGDLKSLNWQFSKGFRRKLPKRITHLPCLRISNYALFRHNKVVADCNAELGAKLEVECEQLTKRVESFLLSVGRNSSTNLITPDTSAPPTTLTLETVGQGTLFRCPFLLRCCKWDKTLLLRRECGEQGRIFHFWPYCSRC